MFVVEFKLECWLSAIINLSKRVWGKYVERDFESAISVAYHLSRNEDYGLLSFFFLLLFSPNNTNMKQN